MIESRTTSQSSGVVETFGAMPKAEVRSSADSRALPAPLSPATSDDLMTALAMLSMQQLHEERGAAEVTHVFGVAVAPVGTLVRNPAFDVTPNRYVTAIITEKGVARAPFQTSLRELAEGN